MGDKLVRERFGLFRCSKEKLGVELEVIRRRRRDFDQTFDIRVPDVDSEGSYPVLKGKKQLSNLNVCSLKIIILHLTILQFSAIKLDHFTKNTFNSIMLQTLKLTSKNWKTSKNKVW